MPKLGFNLLVWTASVSDEHFPIVDRLKKIGYDGIEICNGHQDPAAYRRLGAHLRNVGMEITCVTVLGADANPVSPDAAVRAKALDGLKWNIDRTVDAGSKLLCGPIHSAFATFSRAEPKDEEYQRSAEVLRAAGDYAQQAGVTLALEALNRFECYLCNTMGQLRRLVELTNHPSVRAMFDTHHANIEEKHQADAIRTIAPHLAHVHLSENDRGTPGSGHVNFAEALSTFASVGYDGWMTIEAFSRADPGFANAINVWREFSPAWDIAEGGHAYLRQAIAAAWRK
jgi:D-psicose/D-tagatose/L-ribulose 3-epimerase